VTGVRNVGYERPLMRAWAPPRAKDGTGVPASEGVEGGGVRSAQFVEGVRTREGVTGGCMRFSG